MLFSEVAQKVVVVKVALVTKLAQWMTFIRPVVVVANAPMMAELHPRVMFSVNSKQLQSTQRMGCRYMYTVVDEPAIVLLSD